MRACLSHNATPMIRMPDAVKPTCRKPTISAPLHDRTDRDTPSGRDAARYRIPPKGRRSTGQHFWNPSFARLAYRNSNRRKTASVVILYTGGVRQRYRIARARMTCHLGNAPFQCHGIAAWGRSISVLADEGDAMRLLAKIWATRDSSSRAGPFGPDSRFHQNVPSREGLSRRRAARASSTGSGSNRKVGGLFPGGEKSTLPPFDV